MSSLSTQFHADPIGFAAHHSLAPKDEPTGFSMTATNANLQTTPLSGVFKNWNHRQVTGDARRALVDLEQCLVRDRGDNVVAVKAKMYPPQGRGPGLPTWFLPWDQRGAVVELTIPRHNPNSTDYDSPRFFFTAALSGCSVFVKGSPDSPTVYHCGTSGISPANSPQFFKRMVMTCKNLGIGAPAQGRVQGVGKNAYRDRFTSGAHGVEDRTLVTRQLDDLVRTQGKEAIATSYRRWGAVFGMRIGLGWEFYLQRNLVVMYETMETVIEKSKAKSLFGLGIFKISPARETTRLQITKDQFKSFPSSVEKIFPGRGQVEAMVDNVIVKV